MVQTKLWGCVQRMCRSACLNVQTNLRGRVRCMHKSDCLKDQSLAQSLAQARAAHSHARRPTLHMCNPSRSARTGSRSMRYYRHPLHTRRLSPSRTAWQKAGNAAHLCTPTLAGPHSTCVTPLAVFGQEAVACSIPTIPSTLAVSNPRT